jgi:hypothetical protein
VLLSQQFFRLFVIYSSLSTRFFKPGCKVFCPSIWVLVYLFLLASNYTCYFRLIYEELFYFLRAYFILLFIFLSNFIERGCKFLCGCVRFPYYRTLIVLINTIPLYPMVYFVGFTIIVFCCIFRWSGFVASWWLDGWSNVGWVGGLCVRLGGKLGCFIICIISINM